jgi:hypothetical protein
MSERKKYEGTCPTCQGAGVVPFAYAAIINDDSRASRSASFGIGRADFKVPGYTPMPELGGFKSYDEASARARELNAELGLPEQMSALIVASTMGGAGVADDN